MKTSSVLLSGRKSFINSANPTTSWSIACNWCKLSHKAKKIILDFHILQKQMMDWIVCNLIGLRWTSSAWRQDITNIFIGTCSWDSVTMCLISEWEPFLFTYHYTMRALKSDLLRVVMSRVFFLYQLFFPRKTKSKLCCVVSTQPQDVHKIQVYSRTLIHIVE